MDNQHIAGPVWAVLAVDGWIIAYLIDADTHRWERQYRYPPQPTAAEAVRAYWAGLASSTVGGVP
jgi:hypothetical protein